MHHHSLTLINGGGPLCTIQRSKAKCDEALSNFDVSFNLRRYTQGFRVQLNSLNDFMEEFRFSQPTQKVLRQFMHYQHSNEEVGDYQAVLKQMSPNLRGIVTMKINGKWIKKLRMFHGAPLSFFYHLSAALDQVGDYTLVHDSA